MTTKAEANARLLPISRAREASRRLGLRSMIVMQELPDGRWGYTSYGQTRADCGRAKSIADELMSAIEDTVHHRNTGEAP